MKSAKRNLSLIIIALIAAAALIVGVFLLAPKAAKAEELSLSQQIEQAHIEVYGAPHSHNRGIALTAEYLSSNGYSLATGDYYLTEDINLTATILKQNNSTVNLCLNGYTLNGNGKGSVIKSVYYYGTFILHDCNGSSHGAGKITGGNINDVEDTINGGALSLTGEFKMYGGEISDNIAHNGAGIYLNGSTFTMYGGAIKENNAMTRGGGVYFEGGTFTMYGGTIAGNISVYGGGGGVLLARGKFIMNGGDISDNYIYSNGCGSGVCVDNYYYGNIREGSEFIMNDGIISGNNGYSYGGGVAVFEDCKFTMVGGEISGNAISDQGGGIYIKNGGTVELKGGSIKNNTYSCGIYNYGTILISGKTVIKDNIHGNIYLDNDAVIHIADSLEEGTEIGITTERQRVFTSGYSGRISDAKYFFSDNSSYEVMIGESGELEVGTPVAEAVLGDDRANCSSIEVAERLVSNEGISQQSRVTVNLLSDVTEDNWFIIDNDKYATLDLCGYKLENTGNVPVIRTMGDLILKDSGGSGKITGGNYRTGGGVYVDGGTLEMLSGEISGNSVNVSGGGVYVHGGTFKMSGGKICGNTSGIHGGGVCVIGEGSFTMTGGEISGNNAAEGGGIDVLNNCSFEMSGGEIKANGARLQGGGVYVEGGSFKLTAGKIKENSVSNYGGGVCVERGSFEMTGGTVSDNTASLGGGGGIYLKDGTLKLSGNPVLSGNTFSDEGSTNNIQLEKGTAITVDGALDDGVSIGVTVSVAGKFISGYSSENTAYPNTYFISENPQYPCIYLEGDDGFIGKHFSDENLIFTWQEYEASAEATCDHIGCNETQSGTATVTHSTTKAATCEDDGEETYTATVTLLGGEYVATKIKTIDAIGHSWSYFAEGGTITATCANDGHHTASVTISAPAGTLVYNGNQFVAGVSASGTQYSSLPAIPAISYDGGMDAPVNAGSHTASITWGGVSAEVTFVIAKVTPQVGKPTIEGWTYGESVNLPQASATFGEVKFKYSSEEDGTYGPAPEVWTAGVWFVKAYVEESVNWNSAESAATRFEIIENTFEISVSKPTINGWTYGERANEPHAVATSGKVQFKYSKEENGTYGSAPEVWTAGVWFVKAYIEGTDVESAATQFVIARAESVITVDDLRVEYDGSAHSISGATLNHSEATVTYSDNNEITDVGFVIVTVSVAQTENYLAKSTRVVLEVYAKEITVKLNAGGGVYGGTISAATAEIEGYAEGHKPAIILTYSGTANSGKVLDGTVVPDIAGSFTVTASTTDKNYKLNGTLTAAFVVQKAERKFTVSIEGWIYGSEAGIPVIENTENASVVYLYKGTGFSAATAPEKAGNYTLTVTIGESANYKQASAEVAFTIKKKQVSIPKIEDTYYDGESHNFEVPSDADYKKKSGDSQGVVNVGEYKVVLELNDPENYEWVDENGNAVEGSDVTITWVIVEKESSVQEVSKESGYLVALTVVFGVLFAIALAVMGGVGWYILKRKKELSYITNSAVQDTGDDTVDDADPDDSEK